MDGISDDEVQLDHLTSEPHELLEFFEPRTKMSTTQAVVALPFRDLAHDLNLLLVPGHDKDVAMKALLEARNKAALAVFDQTH